MTDEQPETTTDTPPAKGNTKHARDYHVFVESADGAGWEGPVTTVLASTPRAAVSAYVSGLEEKTGTYAAVPIRSWWTKTIEVEVQERLKFT